MLRALSAISAWIGRDEPSSAVTANGIVKPTAIPSTMPMAAIKQHLRQMDAEHDAACRAEALEGGDHLAPAIDVGRNRIGDADAANQQGGQADQRQELAQPFQRARDLRRGIAPVAHGEAGFGQRLLYASRKPTRPRIGLRRRCRAASAHSAS